MKNDITSLDDLEVNATKVLRAALIKQEISPIKYEILKVADDKTCLVKDGADWIIVYRERGRNFIEGRFLSVGLASKCFYWMLTKAASQYDLQL